MCSRRIIIAVLAAGLGACSSASAPKIELYGMSLPRLELFRFGVEDTTVATTPYPLSPKELAEIKAQFSGEFRDGRTLEFGPVTARQQTTGSLVVCGLVNIRDTSGKHSGMTLFDGVGSPGGMDGRLTFAPKRVAGANAPALDIYSDCRDAGAI